MEFLTRTLGVKVHYKDDEAMPSLPRYINERYSISKVKLDGVDAAFVYPKNDLDPFNIVKKHLNKIGAVFGVVPVLVLSQLLSRQRDSLLADHIPFIVDGKQIYLPFMAAYLQQRFDREKQIADHLSPAGQVLLLHYIYQGCGTMFTSEAGRTLGFTPMTVSRASKELEEFGLIRAKRQGVDKVIFTNKTPEEMFQSAKSFLINPVKRTIYVTKDRIDNHLLCSNLYALSTYSMLNVPEQHCYASNSVTQWDRLSTNYCYDKENQYAIELWRYDPRRLAQSECVDPLSLALSLSNSNDERVQMAVEEMLCDTWRKINGKRNRNL